MRRRIVRAGRWSGAGMLLAFVAATLQAETFDVTVPPRKADAYQTAHYRLWIPERTKTLRGVIVRQHGCGAGARQLGLEHADDVQWQALARKWDCALLGTQLWAPEEDCTTWTIPQDGSEHAFLTALSQLSKASGHAELEFVPWCLWGHSGGAMWVLNMTYRRPQRVIATFPRSGGLAPIGREFTRSQPAKPEDSPPAFDVPILFCHGETENVESSRFFPGIRAAYALFEHGRSHGEAWAIASHPKCDHENGNSRLLSIRFFDAVLAKRLPEAVARPTQPIPPKPMPRDAAWLGDLRTREIVPIGKHVGDAAALAWLPDEATARAWQEFSKTGTLRDDSPPPAPFDVRVARNAEAATIAWQAQADVESGIAEFRVLRDGKPIGKVGGPVDKRWNETGRFHAWNYSDQPLAGRTLPATTFVDAAPDRDPAAKYAVVSVNGSGVESKPGEPTSARNPTR